MKDLEKTDIEKLDETIYLIEVLLFFAISPVVVIWTAISQKKKFSLTANKS